MPDKLDAFYNRVTCLIDGQAVEVVYPDFFRALDTVSQSHYLEKLMCYSPDKRSVRWVGNWLTGCTHGVLVNNSFSSW